MAPTNFFTVGILTVVFLAGIEAQQTLQFSSFSQIPDAVLAQLGSDQIANLKQTLTGGGGGGGGGGDYQYYDYDIPTYQIPNQGGGGGSPGETQTFQFSSFSQIPQSLLDNLPSDQVEQLRQTLKGNGGGGDDIPTFKVPSQPGQETDQTFEFSSFSQIPQSLLDTLSPDQVEQIRQALKPQVIEQQIPSQQVPQQGQTLTFTSFSQIPQNVLDQFTSDQIQQIRMALQGGGTVQLPAPQPKQPPMMPQGQQTLTFTSFSQIPQNILDQFTSDQVEQIRMALKDGRGSVQLPATVTTYSYTIPAGNNKKTNNALNVVFNYIAAGGYLTGIPPVDLLLLRFYLQMGPEKFCG